MTDSGEEKSGAVVPIALSIIILVPCRKIFYTLSIARLNQMRINKSAIKTLTKVIFGKPCLSFIYNITLFYLFILLNIFSVSRAYFFLKSDKYNYIFMNVMYIVLCNCAKNRNQFLQIKKT